MIINYIKDKALVMFEENKLDGIFLFKEAYELADFIAETWEHTFSPNTLDENDKCVFTVDIEFDHKSFKTRQMVCINIDEAVELLIKGWKMYVTFDNGTSVSYELADLYDLS